MAKPTPEQEALYALQWDVSRGDLSMAAQLEYDRLKPHSERKVAATVKAASRPVIRQDVPSARWSRFARQPSVVAPTFGVTVFNWKTITVPWINITDVVLTPATRFTRRGWVPGIAQNNGQVLPVAFAAFLPARRQADGPVPEMLATGEVSEVAAVIRSGLEAHNREAAQSAFGTSGRCRSELLASPSTRRLQDSTEARTFWSIAPSASLDRSPSRAR